MKIPEATREKLESLPNVRGVGIGADDTVVVFVSEKLPLAMLDMGDVVPENVSCEVPDDETGGTTRLAAQTDVVEVGEPGALSPDRTGRWNSVPAGVSVGHVDVTAGTWGTPILKSESGKTCFLTNAHVAAPPSEEPAWGDTIVQPGPHDGGEKPRDAVGILLEWSEIRTDEPNTTDSALFDSPGRKTSSSILGLGTLDGFTDPVFGERVEKSGRTTGVTDSRLVARDVSIQVRGYYPGETVKFTGCDAYQPFSAGGDSGSLITVVRDGRRLGVGLLFAGSSQVTLGIPMSAVEAEHGRLTVMPPGDDEPPEEPPDAPGFWRRLWDWLRELFGL